MSEKLIGARIGIFPPRQQADAYLNQANPTSALPYVVLANTSNVRLIGIALRVEWTVQPSPLEIHVTIDGQVFTFAEAAPVSNTWYRAILDTPYAADDLALDGADDERGRAFLLEGRRVQVTAETTGGTTQTLQARVRWARW